MKKTSQSEIMINHLFSGGENNIVFEVTWFVFTNGKQIIDGKETPFEEIIVNVYFRNPEGKLIIKGSKKISRIDELIPLKIDEQLLENLGFQKKIENGKEIISNDTFCFEDLNPSYEIYELKNKENEKLYFVSYIHEVQKIMNLL